MNDAFNIWEWEDGLSSCTTGASQNFSKGGHTGSNNIVMAFSPRNIVCCLLKRGGGGHGHPRTPLATPLNKETLYRVLHRTCPPFENARALFNIFQVSLTSSPTSVS